MDLPDLERYYYQGISYNLSSLFEDDYDDDYVIQNDADTRIIYDLGLRFSVEKFDASEAEMIEYGFEGTTNKLNAVHDNYILKRQQSLYEADVSIKKEFSQGKFDGLIQIIHGDEYGDLLSTSYFTATLNVDGNYFVFQLIGKRENMGYLYDDFVDILNSVY